MFNVKSAAVIIVAGILYFIAGCANAGIFDVAWVRDIAPSPKPWLYVEVSDAQRVCKQLGVRVAVNAPVYSCASRSMSGCVIYLPKDAPQWLIEHEEKHCAGWSHD